MPYRTPPKRPDRPPTRRRWHWATRLWRRVILHLADPRWGTCVRCKRVRRIWNLYDESLVLIREKPLYVCSKTCRSRRVRVTDSTVSVTKAGVRISASNGAVISGVKIRVK